ncbi:MAG: DNA gyrase subunit A [Oscillospiraceae bacterium]|jgi:DNA gyrase subunit A
MPKKKTPKTEKAADSNIVGLRAEILEQPITETLEENYMPYAMSVIVSRAIPEIDGLKPSHRKLLYTMYKMGLLTGARTKSANVVGQTMRLNPHGDAAIYDTMVRLSRGYEALLHPFVDSKGNFGKVYSRDMACAASRYTEVKLEPICSELFRDIDRDTVDFVDNYDGTMREPSLLPTTFPNVLVAANQGIAVGMASNICGFNLAEVCNTTIEYIKNSDHDIMSTLSAPDFPTGGELIYDRASMEEIYNTGRGSFRLRARWRYIKSENLIEIFEIPYTTTTEAIIDRVADLVKAGKLREIADMRDETDKKGLRLAIDLRRGTDPEKLMQKLFRMTPLQDSFSCNFNILIAGNPRVMGVREIIDEWLSWRTESVRRGVYYDLQRAKERLHLLRGLEAILLDIDRAIKIIRETEQESEVVPNLMIGFGIDELQAEFVAEIKLRNINREYIIKKVAEVEELSKQIEDLEETLKSRARVHRIIISQLQDVVKKHSAPRRTRIIYGDELTQEDVEEDIPDYSVNVFVTREGYFKKITPQSLRMSGEQRLKEGDEVLFALEATNREEILVFTDRAQVYKARLSDFEDTKASVLGDYLPAKLGFDEGENFVYFCLPGNYSGNMLFLFKNGKAAKVALSSFDTKSNRRRLSGAYSDKSPLVSAFILKSDTEIAVYSTDGRAIILNTALIAPKATRTSQGVAVMSVSPKRSLMRAELAAQSDIVNKSRYRVRKIPVAGALIRPEDLPEKQESLF